MPTIIDSTEKIISVYYSVNGNLGVHEPDFHEMLTCIRHAQDTSVDALQAIPNILLTTANKIEDYIALHPVSDYMCEENATFKSNAIKDITTTLNSDYIRDRTIFEIQTLQKSLELTNGEANILQIGGIYKDIKKHVNSDLYEIHHIPPQSVFIENSKKLPAIAILKEDHAKTSTYRGKMKKSYRPFLPSEKKYLRYKLEIQALITQGLLAEAIRNEIYEIRDTFGSKYDGAIKQYFDSLLVYIQNKGSSEISH